ncbi:MAG: bifunctional folylpolyglutamate synthase/dihydrofolate synthase [Anaerolineae bacterium]|nr:bifunctional folylpolyglutamate synthase/dihydrofolate synthase [Anaerolineae bacterium]
MNDAEIAYQEALDYIYSFVDYSLTRTFRYTADKFDLDRVRALLARLGNPHQKYAVIHVTGTKGKGSVSAMLASALRAGGYRTGFYTSPHLSDFCERIQFNGQVIAHADLVRLVEALRPHVAEIEHLTSFEITTALAFLYFAQCNAEIAVIEVGLGGRLDATNVVDPLVSVITSISYDHTNVLGNTLSAIASEKAGIIKPGKPVVVAPQRDEARQVIEQTALQRGAPLIRVEQAYCFTPWKQSLDGQTFLIWHTSKEKRCKASSSYTDRQVLHSTCLEIPLLGYHQVENAATAYAALQVARQRGLYLIEKDIQRGFSQVFWPARFEILRRNPLFVVDCAHNRDSALKLRLTIEEYFPSVPFLLLFGASEDKDVDGMLEELLPYAQRVIFTQSVHPRAMDADKLVELARKYPVEAESVVPVERALECALEVSGHDEVAVVVAGSLFVAAAVRETWQKLGLPLRNFENALYYGGIQEW